MSTAPKNGQSRSNSALVAEQQRKVLQLKMAGEPNARIATALGISKGTVANRLKAARQEYVGPVAEEYVAQREAELDEMAKMAYRTAVSTRDEDVRLRALETARRLNESRRKLRGADALDEAMRVAIEANTERENIAIAAALNEVITRMALTTDQMLYAFDVAAFVVGRMEGQELPDPGRAPEGVGTVQEPHPYHAGGEEYVIVRGRKYVLDKTPKTLRGEVIRTELEGPERPSEEPEDAPGPGASDTAPEPASVPPPAAPDDVHRREQEQWAQVPGYVGARVRGDHLSGTVT